MKTDDRIQFVMRFANAALHKLSAAELRQLQDNFSEFVSPPVEDLLLPKGGGVAVRLRCEGGPPRDLSLANLRKLQFDTCRLLAALLDQQSPPAEIINKTPELHDVEPKLGRPVGVRWRIPGHPKPLIFKVAAGVQVPIMAVYEINVIPKLLQITAPVKGALLLRLLFLLVQAPTHRIRRCPVCEGIFYGIKKQQYCRRTCANRASQQASRERKKKRQEMAGQHRPKNAARRA